MNRRTEEEILLRYKEGKATADEEKLVEDWILNGADFGFDLKDEELLEDLISIRERLDLDRPRRRTIIFRQRFAIAASIMLIASLSVVLFKFNNRPLNPVHLTFVHKPVAEKSATLTLSNGSKIQLDSTAEGTIKEAGVEIANDAGGNITYMVKDIKQADVTEAFNTITTPKGRNYKIILPDGSKVWLNAVSSLRFPISFSGKDRIVELTGEGYFEVAKSNKKFKVLAHNNTTVEVLGTHFNVNSYPNESSTLVTLLEGSVKLLNKNSVAMLKPGEQAEINLQNPDISINRNIDVESLIAWKDGAFKFNDTDLKSIMRQLERWYDVDMDVSSIPDKKFNGTISRDVKLSEVLSMIELTSKLNFKIEGRSVTVK